MLFLTSTMKLILFCMIFLFSKHVTAQSVAIASASATIDEPIGSFTSENNSNATLIGPVASDELLNLEEISFVPAVSLGKRAITIAAFGVIGSSFVFDISLPKNEILLHNKTRNSFLKARAFSISQTNKNYVSSDKRFVVNAIVDVEPLSPSGCYSTTDSIDLIINFN